MIESFLDEMENLPFKPLFKGLYNDMADAVNEGLEKMEFNIKKAVDDYDFTLKIVTKFESDSLGKNSKKNNGLDDIQIEYFAREYGETMEKVIRVLHNLKRAGRDPIKVIKSFYVSYNSYRRQLISIQVSGKKKTKK